MPILDPSAKLIDFAISKKGNSINALCLNGDHLQYFGYPMPDMPIYDDEGDVNMEI